jgi:SAM-dependent methyltransferase
VFDSVAGQYRTARPGYPDALYDCLDELAGGLTGKAVVDLAAGTGIATTALDRRGANVVAVEPSLAMLGRFPFPAVSGRAEALPIRDGTQEMVTCAQAWHWVDPRPSLGECRRVLKAGGRLALWWNVSDSQAGWLKEIEGVSGLGPYGVGRHQDDVATLTEDGAFAGVLYRDIPWVWTVPAATWIQAAASRSALAKLRHQAIGPLGEIRGVVDRTFPGGRVSEPFTCHLAVATAA